MTMTAPLPHTETVARALDGATWVSPHEPEIAPAGKRPAYLLRTSFTWQPVDAPVTLAATAHGIYEAFVNGVRVGDEELAPGFTEYRAQLEVSRHDITSLMRPGTNTVAFLLSDGWYRGRHGFERRADGWGDRTALLAAVTQQGADAPLAATGPAWESRPSHVVRADLMDGQAVDMRQLDPAWFLGGGEGFAPVAPVARGDAGTARLVPPSAPPVRRIEELAPTAVTRPRAGTVVLDLGQNINGWMRLTDLGPAGTRLVLTHGETLDADGVVTTEHLRAFQFSTGTLLDAGQVDEVISAGRAGDVFEPRHTTHGFRYVQIDGVPAILDLSGARGIVVHCDLARTGEFACSDPQLDRLHEVVRWSMRGNVCAVPTDCPQRERSGFTGDWQVFVATGALLADVELFSRRWLRDLAADQWDDGRVPTVVPNPAGPQPSGIAFEDMSAGSAGWGDAAALVPWELWRAYGDAEALAEHLPTAVRWVRYAAASAAGGRHPDRVASRPEPQAHETFLWDTGFHFGEWLEPGVPPHPDPTVDHGIVATAFLHRSAHLTAVMAAFVGDDDAAAECRRIADGALAAWRAEYLCTDGTLTEETQAHYVRALAFGLVPEDLRAATAARLAELVAQADWHLGTGFLATGLLLQALADHGQVHAAFRLLTSTGHPSWLGMLDAGATTMWEWWDGVDADGRARGSLNHYSKGAVASFLHTHVAGLRLPDEPAPGQEGYRRVVVQPIPGPTLTSASSVLETRQGRIAVAWTIEDGTFRLEVDLPDGVEAQVLRPDGAFSEVRGGAHTFACAAGR
ncbi:family 78 glycoside hydrolase catalytic domain [Demequina capsici]|uniref:alpha-L-rhamnosidase n=1 Tax=Demequina capsici TaxID=3075620 RepID=A0AA96FFL2_9MICO|nr:family 78 glycoside hydrolase catalytic domain [Demequina sp. PMTSA13]WNM27686.1 family 78 glycoside hydrolase catalytic domain [Demequina sp. PMTSA13]